MLRESHCPGLIAQPNITMKLTTHLLGALGLCALALPQHTLANPEDLQFSRFADHTLAPSPACLGVHANGDVYVGVDLNGSLGKGPDKGRIVLLQDCLLYTSDAADD